MAKASGSIDLKSLKVAGEGASKYITDITNNGIKVASATASNLNYITIDATGMEIFKTNSTSTSSAISVAKFGETIRVGKDGGSHLELDFHSMNFQEPPIEYSDGIYFSVADLKDETGKLTYTDQELKMAGDNLKIRKFEPSVDRNYSLVIKKNGTVLSSSSYTIVNNDTAVNLGNTAVEESDVITASYTTTDYRTKFFTFGYRKSNQATGPMSIAMGNGVVASGESCGAFGEESGAYGKTSFAFGNGCSARGYGSFAEGFSTIASGMYSHAECSETTASGEYSHAEGYETKASSYASHAEGEWNEATGRASHAEGGFETNLGEVEKTVASGTASHAEGIGTTAEGNASHAEGIGTTASGNYSHSGGFYTTAGYEKQTVIGEYNSNNSGNAFEIGNGTSSVPSNAFSVGWNGNVKAAGLIGGGVGSIIITPTNTNPQNSLGGTWTLIDKQFKPQYIQGTNMFTINSSGTTSLDTASYALLDGHSIHIRLMLTNKVALTDTSVTLGTVRLANCGMTSGATGVYASYPIGYTDAGNGIIMGSCTNTGVLTSEDVVTKTSGGSVAASNVCRFDWWITCTTIDSMIDSFCDKFYWKRTA